VRARRSVLPRTVRTAWVNSLGAGRPARILAWARAADGYCIGSPAALSITSAPSTSDEAGDSGQWVVEHIGWHTIERGGWNVETGRLNWTCYPDEDGRSSRGEVALVEPARIPELFRERVAASIVVQQFVLVDASRGLTVSARRDLGGTADAVNWQVSLGRGLSWRSPGLRELADRELDRLRVEYGQT
jgi:hypothetical protein